MTDETTHLRALLAEQTARAERAESYAGKLEIDVSGFKGTISEQVDRIHTEMARAEKAEAANAELRAALEEAFAIHQRSECAAPPCTCTGFEATRALLSRPDLGAGMVVVERETLERWRDVVVDAVEGCELSVWSRLKRLRADLDALLNKKVGG